MYRFMAMCLFGVFLTGLAGTPALAQDDDTFTVALTGKYPPFSFYNESGDLVGFDVDVSKEVARRLGLKPEIITTEWDGILAGLLAKRYDAIIGSMAITPEREKKVNFSRPYYVSGAQLFIHQNDRERIHSIDDLPASARVGVVLGTTFEHYLTQNYPDLEVVTYKSDVYNFQEMLNERLVGFVSDRLVGMYQIKKAGMPFVPAGPLLYKERMGIPVHPDRTDLLRRINQALLAMEQDAFFDTLHEKWFGSAGLDVESVSGEVMGKEPAERTEATVMPPGLVARMLARGFAITLFVAFSSLFIGFVLALPAGLVLNRPLGFARAVCRAVVDFIRGTPVLIQLFFVYFSAPQIGIELSPLQSAILTLSVNAAAYMAEVIRSGLMAVDPGQAMAGRALGLSKVQVFRFIVWPQAFRIAIPPLMNSAVALLKDTALISVISVSEVVREAQSIISVTFDPMKYYFMVGVMFFVFTFPLMKLAGVIESRIKQRGFKNA